MDSMQQIIENNYRRFIQLVAEGRNLEREDVEKVAQGRVWAGKTARELGLVDKFGNLQDALRSAADLGGIEEFDVLYIEQDLTAREKLIRRLNRILLKTFKGTLGQVTHPVVDLYNNFGRDLGQILELNDPSGIYAYCMMCEIQ
jgi:protease-4